MMNKKIELKNQTPVARPGKLAYATPFLIKHGELRELTQSGTQGVMENTNENGNGMGNSDMSGLGFKL
jgi:hypothetical protein